MTSARPWRAGAVAAFVWGTLVALLVQALVIIATDGRDLPLAEDWNMVPALTGNEPRFLEWLWYPINEHRVPVPKLLYLVVLKLAGGDFRSGMVLNALTLAALAAACVRVASARPGGLRLTDAFFPLVLLHAGQAANYAWGWQVQFVSAVLFTCAPLLVMVRHGAFPPPGAAAVAAVSIACLPFTGANGLIFFLALAPWYALVLLRQRAEPRPPGAVTRSALLGAGFAVGVAFSALYALLYFNPGWQPPNPGLVPSVKTALKFAGMAIGPGVWEHRVVVAVVLAPVVLGAAVLLVVRGRRALAACDDERWRVAGLVCFLGGCLVLVAAMGYGRAAWVPEFGMPPRYAILAAPTIVAAYHVWDLYGAAPLAAAARWALLALALLCLPANHREGRAFVDWYRAGMDRALADVDAGVPRLELARRHREHLLHWDEPALGERIGMLRDAGMGPFARLRRDGAAR